MTSRDEILARIRKNQPSARPLPDVPAFAQPKTAFIERFKSGVVRMGGRVEDAPADGNLEALLQRLFPDAKVIVSATTEVGGNRPIDRTTAPAALDDVDVGVARAAFGVAETGSVWLTDAQLQVDALAFLAQHLVVLLDPARIVGNLHDAYRDWASFEARYGVFLTGPSATADIEGVLIHGAQGIRSLTVVLVPS